jgi:hypothetical protein
VGSLLSGWIIKKQFAFKNNSVKIQFKDANHYTTAEYPDLGRHGARR